MSFRPSCEYFEERVTCEGTWWRRVREELMDGRMSKHEFLRHVDHTSGASPCTHRRLCFMPSIPNDIPRQPWTLCTATGDTRQVSNAPATALSSLADSTQHLLIGVEDDDEYMCWLSFGLAYNGAMTVYGHIVKGECPSFNHSSDLDHKPPLRYSPNTCTWPRGSQGPPSQAQTAFERDYSSPKKVMPDTCHRRSTQRRHQFCSDFCKYKAAG